MNNKYSIFALLFLVVIIFSLIGGGIFCFSVGGEISISLQIEIYKSLKDVSVVIFAILGIWIAVICPDILREIYRDGISADGAKKELNKVKLLSVPMLIAASCFCIIISVLFIYPSLIHNSLMVSNKIYIRKLSYLFLYIILVVQFWSLFISILPTLSFIDNIKIHIKKRENKQMYQKNIQ